MKNQIKKSVWICLVVLAMIFVFLAGSFILNSAPTFDEGVHLASGYSYWKTGELLLNIKDHPPLSKRLAALPLLFMGVAFQSQHPTYRSLMEWKFSDIFIYWNKVKAGTLINSGRFATLTIGLLLGFFVFLWSRDLYGAWAGAFSFFIFALNPGMIANSSLITADIWISLGYFLSVYGMYRFVKAPGLLSCFYFGAAVGLCLVSKYSGVTILPVLFVILAYLVLSKRIHFTFHETAKYLGAFCAGILVLIVISFGFSQINMYFTGVGHTFNKVKGGRSSFLWGEHSVTGWWYYFLFAVITKNPLVFILLIISIATAYILKAFKSKRLFSDEFIFLVFPPAVYFAAASFSKFQIGHRHVILVYPFLFVWSGCIFRWIRSGNILKSVIILFTVMYSVSALHCFPHFLSYFNVLVGGTGNGYKYMIDSNYDWGQGLKGLGRYLEENNINNIYLSYFGTADPHYYGIRYIPVGFYSMVEREGDEIDMAEESKKIIAISATNLQANYYADKSTFGYFRKMEPLVIIDYTIFLYDITNDIEANSELLRLFYSMGDDNLVSMQSRIIKSIKDK